MIRVIIQLVLGINLMLTIIPFPAPFGGKKMTTEQTTPAQPKKKNCFLWGCLIVLVMICLVAGCLGTFVALPFFTGIDPLGLENLIDEFIPWEDFMVCM